MSITCSDVFWKEINNSVLYMIVNIFWEKILTCFWNLNRDFGSWIIHKVDCPRWTWSLCNQAFVWGDDAECISTTKTGGDSRRFFGQALWSSFFLIWRSDILFGTGMENLSSQFEYWDWHITAIARIWSPITCCASQDANACYIYRVPRVPLTLV